ncbi:guanine nucleotide exchange factor DBS isoform X2 [Pelobates cultripes]|uniref:Guanine nucleotide exchange factor DBS isoform X2 n=1 Tax=Pelobates cultripes TaxID=61616 RepID=A0AAD1RCK1_PELCU|nr:guanine nucleotide exchange factor DBS isoform X2 [Pelobates cultripes]
MAAGSEVQNYLGLELNSDAKGLESDSDSGQGSCEMASPEELSNRMECLEEDSDDEIVVSKKSKNKKILVESDSEGEEVTATTVNEPNEESEEENKENSSGLKGKSGRIRLVLLNSDDSESEDETESGKTSFQHTPSEVHASTLKKKKSRKLSKKQGGQKEDEGKVKSKRRMEKVIMLNSVSDLHGHIDKSQLTSELGGYLEYSHSQWIQHRTAIESFAQVVKTTAQNLQTFGTSLAETELPNDVLCTEELLLSHTEKQDKLKNDLKLALQQGRTLLVCIKDPISKDPNYKLNPDEQENKITVERLLAQLDETEKAFDEFWSRHHLKLEQCLQLRHFEHGFRELKLALDALMEIQATFTDIGDSVTRVEQLLKELKQLEEKGQGSLEKAQLHALHGDQLIQNNHYAVDSIRPKCVELRRICDDFTNETKKKYDILGKSLELHQELEKANHWCEDGIYLLASQAVDKCQSQDGAESALHDIEKFLGSSRGHQLSNPSDFYIKYEAIMYPEIKLNVQKVLKKLDDVQEMFDKRQASLKKLAAKQTRPVQPVAPHPESSPKRASPKTTRPASLATTRRVSEVPCTPPKSLSEADLSRKRNNKKAKGGIKIEVMHEASQGGTSRTMAMSESEENLSSRKSHIINELIETERVYVEELQSIIEGYASSLENPEMITLIPAALQNNKDILFGNLPEIYEFHKRIFLKELEKCTENTDSLGRCFLKRKEDLQIYEKYCQNKPRSEALWRQCGESIFFQECQRKLDHKLSLDAYLLKPVQRITKYQLLLKEMLKCSKNSEGTAELEEALATVLDIIKSVNDSMHQIAITGYEGDLNNLGKLLMQGSFNVWTDHKRGHNKVKDLARFKPMQRHLFLYAKTLLFCKKREETTEGHEKSPSYSFKNALKMSSVGITENVKGDNKKFEVWYNGREEVYIIQASTVELKSLWVSEIRKVLTGQLEACREASQLHQRITESVYHAPMNSSFARSNKTSLNSQNKADSSSVNASNNKNRASSPAGKQKKGDSIPPSVGIPLAEGAVPISLPVIILSVLRLLERDSHCRVFRTAERHPKLVLRHKSDWVIVNVLPVIFQE